ncbi:MAG: hypothetical protein H6839_05690 [Planctomycetes bacterium]|nr:hypothetical protein [Planctomycetota bacterium]
MNDHYPQPERFLNTARKIRRAGGVGEIASAVISGATLEAPSDTLAWRRRAIARRAVETTLRCLQMSIAQHALASPEIASDMRIEARRHLVRILATVADVNGSETLADLAVSAITPETAAESMVKAAQQVQADDAARPQAVCSLGGQMLISTPALALARKHGVDEPRLQNYFAEAAAPVRRACATAHACQVGELRFRKIVPEHGLCIVAQLDGAAEGAPVISLTLSDAATPAVPAAFSSAPSPDDAYPARLLRRLVS